MPPPDDRWPPAGRPRRWPAVLGLVTAVVLVGVIAAVVVQSTRGPGVPEAVTPPSSTSASASASAPAPPGGVSGSPTAPASTSPTAAPATPIPTQPTTQPTGLGPTAAPGPDRSLRTNSLYGLDLGKASVSCDLKVRRPKPPLANSKLEGYLDDVVDCLAKVWTQPLAQRGFTLVKPKIETFHKKVKTPCGTFGQEGSPAYYCSASHTIYWPDTVDDGREAYTFARLGYVGLTAHEFGHHIQATTGMLSMYAAAYQDSSKKARYALSRRLELQAQCFEGIFLHATRKDLDVSSQDRRELKAWHSYTGDEDPPDSRKPDHGTSKAQYGWLERGLDSGDLDDCNTWTAKTSDVR